MSVSVIDLLHLFNERGGLSDVGIRVTTSSEQLSASLQERQWALFVGTAFKQPLCWFFFY